MLTSNNLYKLNKEGQIKRVNTDDIPEGQYNKYALNYVDGKSIGDIVLRNDPTEKLAHALLDGRRIHAYECKLFIEWAKNCKELSYSDIRYEFFNKTEEEYEEFYANNVFENTQEHYCPYYVVKTEEITVYQVSNDLGTIGYTPIYGESDTELTEGYVFKDTNLEEIINIVNPNDTLEYRDEWYYNGISEVGEDRYVRIPTYPTYNNGNMKSYYFIITDSRSDNDMTSIRSVEVGNVETLENMNAYVRNVGTVQKMILDFGIPKGSSATIKIGEVRTSEEFPEVENVGTENDAILNFTLPRGEQGPAGGVVSLNYVSNSVPLSPKDKEKFYDLTNNKIYIYLNGVWNEYEDAIDGVLYAKDSIVYHFNGKELIEFSNIIYVDEETIEKNNNGTLTTIGVKSMNNGVFHDWVGTLEEWEIGRDNGTIKDNWICYVIDDE